jgi:peptidoglycan/LPS O-acetylase OafA/YrhL
MHHRREELDGLRAIAALLVIGFHASDLAFVGGWVGVDIFFVLSGYLITTILTAEFERSGTIAIGTFYLKRVLRLAPALLALLSFNLLASLLFGETEDRSEHIGATIASLFYVMNWVRAFHLPYEGHVGHVWSLAVEEQFYIIWPALLWLALLSGGRRAARILVCLLISVVVLWRCYLVLHGEPPYRTYNGFDTRSDALFIGCLLALSASLLPARLKAFWLMPVGALEFIALFANWDAPWVHLVGFDIIAVSAAWIIFSLSENSPLKSLLSTRPAVFLGSISYGMYLWHAFFTSVLLNEAVPVGYVLLAILPLTISCAAVSYFLVEKRFLDLKDRLGVRRPDDVRAHRRHASAEPTR